MAYISQLCANFNILRWFPPLSVSWSRLSFSFHISEDAFRVSPHFIFIKHTRRRDSNPGPRSSDKLTNKPVIDHVPLLWFAQTSKRATQANSQIRKGQLKRNMIHLLLSLLSPTLSLSHTCPPLPLPPSFSLPPPSSLPSVYEFPLLGTAADGEVFSMQPLSRTEPC